MRTGTKISHAAKFKVEYLHCQMCPWVYCSEVWDGDESGLIENSPHVDFLKRYQELGIKILSNLHKTRYSKMYENWDDMGYGLGGRTPDYIKKKARSLMSVFDSICKKGYNRKNKIHVMDKPLWTSRGFDGGDALQGPEIFHGHHRSACLYVLNYKVVKVMVVKDTLPGTNQWPQKLTNVRR